MRIVINISGKIFGGSRQAALSFIEETKGFTDNQYHIFLGYGIYNMVDIETYGPNYTFYYIPELKFYRLSPYLSKLEKAIHPDVVFTVFGPSYWKPKALHLTGFARGYMIYPESPFWKTVSVNKKLKLRLINAIHRCYFKHDADAYICETEDAANRISKMFGNRKSYFTVSNTCGSQYFNESLYNLPPKLPIRKESEFRFITLSNLYPHKNIDRIPLILDKLFEYGIKYITFVLTISEEDYDAIFGDKYRENTITVGSVAHTECPSLYRECDAMFLPTTMECFSASYPEAMAMRKPIVTSDLDFAHSICGDAAIFADPTDITAMADAILKIAQDQELRNTLIKKGTERLNNFPSASQRAEKYLEICKKLTVK